jgi:hypothetical protein
VVSANPILLMLPNFVREDEAIPAGRRFTPTIESPYRWRDWQESGPSGSSDAVHNAMTGTHLMAFINQDEECTLCKREETFAVPQANQG